VANVYSVNFFTLPAVGAGGNAGYTVDASHVAVVRTVTAFATGTILSPTNGFYLTSNGVPFVGVFGAKARAATFYTWDMHVVVESGNEIAVTVVSTGGQTWAITASGYLLSLP
jgi:hypothetical protein